MGGELQIPGNGRFVNRNTEICHGASEPAVQSGAGCLAWGSWSPSSSFQGVGIQSIPRALARHLQPWIVQGLCSLVLLRRDRMRPSAVSEAVVHQFFSPSLSAKVAGVWGVEQETEKPLKTCCIVLRDPVGQLLQWFSPQTSPTGPTAIPLEQSYGLLLSC